MKRFLKFGLPFALLLSPGVNAEPCWQSQSVLPADGSLCIVIDDEVKPGKPQWYFGRAALDLTEPVQAADNKKNFCVYEVKNSDGHDIKRSRNYFWLNATEREVLSSFYKLPMHKNDPLSPDQSDKWVMNSGSLVGLFRFCSAERPKDVGFSDLDLCVKPLPNNGIAFGKFTHTTKCKVFDAGVGKELMPLSELQTLRKDRPDITWVGEGWAVRDGQPFATHTVYGIPDSTEYCLLQAMIRGHQFCSVDKTGHYQTGNEIDYGDTDGGINDAYRLNYSDKPKSKSEL
ncbi:MULTISPECIES: hypothetical protein [unclassified Endozoicomonas]|uniref:hypothetical protein n=1 Tax=unclassified Endozoicomonas TaxID=2644528 RepID=UPI0021489912|nr:MULTISPECIES: hypothetical protein [unclassified Endozoicomonas]